ncbi:MULTISPECIES: hypothetical protein [Liquorilactobacillus]|jgi:hypothetical protein|nr:hypothetical protein [Liquorilactobacillus nagelii]
MGPKQLDYQFYDRLINEMNLPFTLTLVCEKIHQVLSKKLIN